MADASATPAATASAGTAVRVQVCYALPDDAFLQTLQLPTGTRLAQALAASELLQRFPALKAALDGGELKVGIFGKLKPTDTVLRDGDRIEVYRPLQADPKESRRRRAKHKQQAASGS